MKISEIINSPNQTARNGVPHLIVKHIADGTYDGTKAWFLNPAAETSSHFIVAKDGRICQCVPLDKTAWCNGTSTDKTKAFYFGNSRLELVRQLGGNANHYSVSIEFEGKHSETMGALTEAQIEVDVWLTNHICQEVKRIYGHDIPIDRSFIVGHNEVAPKSRPNCPGQKFPWSEVMAKLTKHTEPINGVLYRVQVGAYKSKSNAEAYQMQVQKQYPQTFITHASSDGLYRVQVGAFAVKSNAEGFLKDVRAKGLPAFLIVEEK